MNKGFLNPLSLRVLFAFLGLMPSGLVPAQTFTVLHSFTGIDGGYPAAGLVLSRGSLYGTTASGGSHNGGTVFKVNLDGTGFTNLYDFTGGVDGGGPRGSLVLGGNTMYGTCAYGGSGSYGTVFALNADGTGFRVLHSFGITNGDGTTPPAGLILLGNALYGTTSSGGSGNGGTVFCLNTDGSSFTNLHSFTGVDGSFPFAALVSLSNTLYGTTIGAFQMGGDIPGTVFSINTDGTGFRTLHAIYDSAGYNGHPNGGLVLLGNTLYGTAQEVPAAPGGGTVFKINTDGTGFGVLHEFAPSYSDGAEPFGILLLSGNTLYGTCLGGGSSGNGTVFAINTDSTGFTNLYNFTGGADGAGPTGGLILSANTLYGAAGGGGSGGNGTIFSISLLPQLTLTRSAANVILSWPTNYAGFDYTGYTLQSSTSLISPVWTTNLPAPVVVNGQYTVTNRISATLQFFRLSQ